MVTPTMFPVDKKAYSRKKSRLHFCINSLVPYKLSHDRWLWFFFFGRLRVPTRRCDLVVPADWRWGRSNKIIYDQRSRNIFVFYSRDLPKATFTRLQGERVDIPEGPPQFDSDGHEILTDEEFLHSDGEENNTDEESE